MPSPARLRESARQSMRGRTPGVFLIAIVYLLVFNAMYALDWHLGHPGSNIFQLYASYLHDSRSLRPEFRPGALSTLVHLAVSIVQPIWAVGMSSVFLNVSRNREAGFGNLLDGFRHFLKFFWLNILIVMYAVLWSLLLVVPGIVALYRYRMAQFILLDNPEFSPSECIRRSKEMMNGKKLDLLKLDLSFVGWLLLSIIPLAGFFFKIYTVPYMNTAHAAFYNCLSGHNHRKSLKHQKSRVK